MIATFILILLFSLALFHWAYESAIAPSWRLGIRYKLFALRDEIRNFAAQESIQINQPAIETLEDAINAGIHYMREINFGFMLSVKTRYKNDPSFREQLDHRRLVVDGCQDPEFRTLCRRYQHLFREINLVNSGGWIVYLVPLIYVVACWKWLKRFFTLLSLVPSAEFPALSRGTSDACAEPA